MGEDASETLLLVAVQPGIDGIRVARFEEPVDRHRMRAHPTRDLHEGGTPLPDQRAWVMIPRLFQRSSLLIIQLQGAEV